jgi:glutamate synthase domain-containing protein 1
MMIFFVINVVKSVPGQTRDIRLGDLFLEKCKFHDKKRVMCGIVGLFLKRSSLEPDLGALFSEMLICMSSRGPDSAGFAVYGDSAPPDKLKVILQHSALDFDWSSVAVTLEKRFRDPPSVEVISSHARFLVKTGVRAIRDFLRENFPEVRIMSVGRRIEIMKETGRPESIVKRFSVRKIAGSHAIGHTRMATESAVTTEGSHPFSAGVDLCLVHNGSLSNHNRLRQRLRRQGVEFHSENDTEVAAGYFAWQLANGATLKEALEAGLSDLDGFYTFTVGTEDGFAVLRDPIACKPAVLAETDDYVAMASEYRSLANLPGIKNARLWEPEPAVVYNWSRTDSREVGASKQDLIGAATAGAVGAWGRNGGDRERSQSGKMLNPSRNV